LPILLNMQPAASKPGRFDGEVYNAQNGKTYTAHIALTAPDTLAHRGLRARIPMRWAKLEPRERDRNLCRR
jgi:hypothetical protein